MATLYSCYMLSEGVWPGRGHSVKRRWEPACSPSQPETELFTVKGYLGSSSPFKGDRLKLAFVLGLHCDML